MLLGDGDVAGRGSRERDRVAFERDRRIWIAPIDGSKPAEQAFFARGTSERADLVARRRARLRSSRTATTTASSACSRPGNRSATWRRPRRATRRRSGRPTAREIAFVRQPGRGGAPRRRSLQQPSPWALWVARRSAAPGRRARPGRAASGRTGRFDRVSRRGAIPLHWARRRPPRVHVVPGRLAAPLLAAAPRRRQRADAAHARRVHGRARLADARPAHPRLQREHRQRRARHRPPASLHGAGRRGRARDADAGTRHRMGAGRDRRRRARWRSSRPTRSGRRCQRSCRSPAARRAAARGRPRAGRRCPPRRWSRRSRSSSRRPTASRSTDSCSRPPAAPARRPALDLRARRAAAADAARLALHGLLRERLRDEPVPGQPRVHRAVGELPAGHRLRPRVPLSRRAAARAAPPNTRTCSPGRGYLQRAPTSTPTRLGIWGGSYGGYLTALALGRNSDVFAAGVDIHGVHNWDRSGRGGAGPARARRATASREADLKQAARVAFRVVADLLGADVEIAGAPHPRRRRPQRRVPPDRGPASSASPAQGVTRRGARHSRTTSTTSCCGGAGSR